MAADLILRAGPLIGGNAEPEVVRLAKIMETEHGCSCVRAHRHGSWIVVEGWRTKPLYPEAMPSAEFISALVAGEIENWSSADGYAVSTPRAPSEDGETVDP